MAFAYTTGIAAAPNEIDNWFAVFQAWVAAIGWTVESGGGTDDLVISSLGEHGDKTMLFIRIWRVPATNVVRMETRNDAAGTQNTSADNGLDSGGVQFNYWMSGDLDSVAVVWERTGTYYLRYAGLLMPFALNPPDETYYSASAYRLLSAAILRRFDHAWDQNDTNYWSAALTIASIDADDGSFPIGGLYFGDRGDIAGQYKHLSCRIQDAVVTMLDTITTQQDSGDTEWIVLADQIGYKFAMRTGGINPTGDPPGTFTHSEGVAYTTAAFFAALGAFMVGNGFTALDVSGISGRTHDWEFHGTGESGAEDIFIRASWTGAPNHFFLAVADSTLGTPGRHETTNAEIAEWTDYHFPTQFYFSGDRDCVVLTINDSMQCMPLYAGVPRMTARNLSSPFMRVVVVGGLGIVEQRLLLSHAGAWNQQISWQWGGDGAQCTDSSPNLYDGETMILWPLLLFAGTPMVGQMKYTFACAGDALSVCDLIRVNGEIYKVFTWNFGGNYRYWAMRVL